MTLDNEILHSHLNLDGDEVDQDALDRAHSTAVTAIENFIGSTLEEAGDPTPAPLITAVLQLTAHFYEHRDPVITGDKPYALPLNVFDLVGPYRDFTFG